MPQLEFDPTTTPGVAYFSGEVDTMTKAQFKKALEQVVADNGIVDLSGVSYLGSEGIAALISSQEDAGKPIRIVCPSGLPRRTIKMCRLDACDGFMIFSTIEAAQKSLQEA